MCSNHAFSAAASLSFLRGPCLGEETKDVIRIGYGGGDERERVDRVRRKAALMTSENGRTCQKANHQDKANVQATNKKEHAP